MSSQYPRGSEWRKWDLHVHTPKSIVQEYGGDTEAVWNQFIEKLASLPEEIRVLGITDYLFVDGYEYLCGRKAEFPNIELLIPNIEFRLDTFAGTVNAKRRHNFHVLFDPSVPVAVIREQLLSCLSKGYRLGDKSLWQQTPTIRSLSELGQQIKAQAPAGNSVHNKSDLRVGFDNITYKREDIVKCLEEKSCFRGKYIIAIGFSEWDQARWDQSAAEKRDLINSSHFCMNNVPDPAQIAVHREDLKLNQLNSIIFHCSDAHQLPDIGVTLQWIKADPTFAGLKQVMNEPDGRSFIGDMPPSMKPEHKVIKKIAIAKSNNWFPENFEIELNRDLVTIIGGRGSGKSALAEAIAYGAGSRDEHNDAFLYKATKHRESIANTDIIVQWADGTQTSFRVGQLKQDKGLVRYLPQGAVEELCAPEHSNELQQQIENVIFQALPEQDRLGASNFTELRGKALRQFDHEKKQLQKKVSGVNGKIADTIDKISGRPSKLEARKEKQEELKRLKKSLPQLPDQDKKAQDELAALEEQKVQLESVIAVRHATMGMVLDVESRVQQFQVSIDEFHAEIEGLLASTGITFTDTFKATLDTRSIKKTLDERIASLKSEIETIRSGDKEKVAALVGLLADALFCPNLNALGEQISQKSKETKAFETQKLKYQRQKKLIQETDTAIKAINSEVEDIDKTLIPERKRLEEERIQLYCNYFDVLRREKQKIEGLYGPLQQSLLGGSETKRRLVFEARINYRLHEHNEAGLGILDRTRKGNFRELGALKNALESSWEECAKVGMSVEGIKQRLSSLGDQFTQFEGVSLSIEAQLRESLSLQDFYEWLFDATYFEVVSSLKFDGVELYFLSPGQKGIILMMLYLAIDRDDYRPLIIDQPEENLDNLSVYSDLMEYFRERKIFRQIIMVTHNPNLVVNTDAEQVVVAKYHGERVPRLEYQSGSLENQAERIPNIPLDELEDGIIEQVCDILEGGKTAFGNRKRKYQLSEKVEIA